MPRPDTLDLGRTESAGLAIEHHSIDYIPEHERHAKLASQGPFWFLGNFHFFTISIGFELQHFVCIVCVGLFALSAKNTNRAKLIAVIFAGASLSGTWMIGLGAWLAQKLHAADALVAMNDVGTSLMPGLGKLIAIVSLVGFLPIIALNAYSAMLTVLTGADSIVPIRPTRCARVASIIAHCP
ncbi:hypothetical protein [Burkholderia contaminans]|uniref:hypothetical protein n=1 Tax=Burkholderia contaminans TaxID=488447 RepID=UPI0021AB5848|nr:hypothetical protein [Burkholderia contaminans]